jgi:hypothetical protein
MNCCANGGKKGKFWHSGATINIMKGGEQLLAWLGTTSLAIDPKPIESGLVDAAKATGFLMWSHPCFKRIS